MRSWEKLAAESLFNSETIGVVSAAVVTTRDPSADMENRD